MATQIKAKTTTKLGSRVAKNTVLVIDPMTAEQMRETLGLTHRNRATAKRISRELKAIKSNK